MLTWERFSDDFFKRYFEFRPEEAIGCGVEGYENHLSHFNDETDRAQRAFFKGEIKAIRRIPQKGLTEDEKIDYALLRGMLIITNYEFAKSDERKNEPYLYLPFSHLDCLTKFPGKDPGGSIVSCLGEIPRVIEEGVKNLEQGNPPKLWTEMAIDEIDGGLRFLASLRAHPVMQGCGQNYDNQVRLARALGSAQLSIRNFRDFLVGLLPDSNGTYAVGEEHFNLLLREKHFMKVDARSLLRFGERLFVQVKKELFACAEKIAPEKSVADVAFAIQENHPSSEELLDAYRKATAAAREFVRDRGIVSFPPREELRVIETPEFMRHEIPFAAYLSPPPNDPAQVGYYYVTPATDDDTLGEHNWRALENTSAHEAYPGHHLQFATANSHSAARTLPRLTSQSSAMFEGWALYCEQLMHDQGFLGTPEHEFIMLKDRLWRTLRIIIDVKTQLGLMTYDEAADIMMRELSFPRSQAEADLNWYSQAPATPMGYALGWHMITRLRKREEKRLGKRFLLREFHDTFLSAGSIAPSLIIKRHFRY